MGLAALANPTPWLPAAASQLPPKRVQRCAWLTGMGMMPAGSCCRSRVAHTALLPAEGGVGGAAHGQKISRGKGRAAPRLSIVLVARKCVRDVGCACWLTGLSGLPSPEPNNGRAAPRWPPRPGALMHVLLTQEQDRHAGREGLDGECHYVLDG